MNHRYERGDTIAIIFAVLVVAIMTLLGIVLYQNFVAKPETSNTREPEVKTVVKDATVQMTVGEVMYELDHPSGWSAVATPVDTKGRGEGNSLVFENSNKTIRVAVKIINNGDRSEACTPDSSVRISHYKVHDPITTNLLPEPLYMVESIVDNLGGGYNYRIGLTPDSGATHAVVGESACNLKGVGVVQLPKLDEKSSIQPVLYTDIELLVYPHEKKPSSKDKEQLQAVIKSDDYQTAVKIIQSVRKK